MNDIKQNRHGHEGPNSVSVHHSDRPYWKRAHRDWRFWGAVFLMLAAMIIYMMSEYQAWRPRIQPQQPVSDAVGK